MAVLGPTQPADVARNGATEITLSKLVPWLFGMQVWRWKGGAEDRPWGVDARAREAARKGQWWGS